MMLPPLHFRIAAAEFLDQEAVNRDRVPARDDMDRDR
jgi:hypothetical protein